MKPLDELIGEEVFWIGFGSRTECGINYATDELKICSGSIAEILITKDKELYVKLDKDERPTNLKIYGFTKYEAVEKYRKFLDDRYAKTIESAKYCYEKDIEQLNKLLKDK